MLRLAVDAVLALATLIALMMRVPVTPETIDTRFVEVT